MTSYLYLNETNTNLINLKRVWEIDKNNIKHAEVTIEEALENSNKAVRNIKLLAAEPE